MPWIAHPTNHNGPGDNYHPENSHVVPALICRFHKANEQSLSEVVVCGSGTPKREFLYVDDMAEASLFVHNLDQAIFVAQTEPMLSHVNVGTGTDVIIRDLSETIKEVVGFEGNFGFDTSKPDSPPRKLMDVEVLSNLRWTARVGLRKGLRRSYLDFQMLKMSGRDKM
jgi:nucleoside-diphosphate-sugar epimerase